jgi:FAD/FMN-containing dehydrogenase
MSTNSTNHRINGRPDFVKLQSAILGEVVRPGGSTFDEDRLAKNLRYASEPAAIVHAASAADVATAVRFGRAAGLELAVRSGGHSIPGYSGVDGGLVIDLSQLKAISIDAATRTARVQAGATSADLAPAAHAYGLALSTGDTGSVGLGGLVTGGGIGFLARKYGLAIDSLLAAQVVTADGEIVRASATENADLFWAIRGGGGNFGIVTEFEFQMAPVGAVYGGALVLPATRDVIRRYLELSDAAPDELTIISFVMFAPPAPFVPEERVGELSLNMLVVYCGDPADGEAVLQPFRDLAPAIADTLAPMPYPAIYEYLKVAEIPGRVVVRSQMSYEISDDTLDVILKSMETAPSPLTLVNLRVYGGAMGRVAPDATAFVHRDKKYMTSVIVHWDEETDDAKALAWAQALFEYIRPEGAGVYANFLDREGERRVSEAYAGATLARLAAVKAKYDPDNDFHRNQNVKPSVVQSTARAA